MIAIDRPEKDEIEKRAERTKKETSGLKHRKCFVKKERGNSSLCWQN
jgi:hypothetical protein